MVAGLCAAMTVALAMPETRPRVAPEGVHVPAT
jgi:hypothetical protein